MTDQVQRLEIAALSVTGPAHTAARTKDAEAGDLRILLVDDDRGFRSMLRGWLSDQGISKVVEASDGLEALDLAARVQPDLVLMDARMPRMSGIEAAERMEEILPGVQIILLTGYEEEEIKRAGVAAGLYRFFGKDCSPDVLWSAIQQAAKPGSPGEPGAPEGFPER